LCHADQGITFVVRYDRNSPEKRLIGYPCVSTYGQTFDSSFAPAGYSGRNIDSTASKIESNVTLGLAAADQQIGAVLR
jgi:hypothetical protein